MEGEFLGFLEPDTRGEKFQLVSIGAECSVACAHTWEREPPLTQAEI